MRSVELVEYPLILSTGESLLVSELDPELCPQVLDPSIISMALDVLSLCTRAPRAAVEDSKSGYPEALEPFLGTPPDGCLLRLSRPCGEMKICPMADKRICVTSYRKVREGFRFPICWTYGIGPPPRRGPPLPLSEMSILARDLSDSIVHSWKEGRLVVIPGPR